MKTNLKEINSYTRQLDITIYWHLIKKDYQNEFKRARSSYSMPGFRKGKVPEKIVKQKLGASIEANFAENSINTYFRKALHELHLTPINQASINKLNAGWFKNVLESFAAVKGSKVHQSFTEGYLQYISAICINKK